MYFTGCFLKFGEKEHIKLLQERGQLYCKPISDFTKIEDGNLRGDKLEDVIRQDYIGECTISLKNIEAPDSAYLSFPSKNARYQAHAPNPFGNIYCLSTINVNEKPIGETFTIDKENKRFGDSFLLIYNIKKFLDRVFLAFEKEKLDIEYNLVNYLDLSTYSGSKTVFQKDIEYAYQKEFRIFIKNGSVNPINIEIGDISDISILYDSSVVDHFLLKAKNIAKHNISQYEVNC